MSARRRYEPSPARARAIRQAASWASMSQYDLARAVGVSRTTVEDWMAGRRDPGPANLIRIAIATRTRVSSLLTPVTRTERAA